MSWILFGICMFTELYDGQKISYNNLFEYLSFSLAAQSNFILTVKPC
jgi:hypothetical protein